MLKKNLALLSLLCLCTALLAALSAGCGGSKTSATATASSAAGAGRATFTVILPERAGGVNAANGRLIPTAADTIVVEMFQMVNGVKTIRGSKSIDISPDASPPYTTTIDNLPIGTLSAEAKAYNKASVIPLAAGETPTDKGVVITDGGNTTFFITLNSAIDKFTVSPPAATINNGQSATFSVSALDAKGAMVLLPPGQLNCTVSDPMTAVTVGAKDAAHNFTVTANAGGQSTITVTYAEGTNPDGSPATKTASTVITVPLVVTPADGKDTISIFGTKKYVANGPALWDIKENNGAKSGPGGEIDDMGNYAAPEKPGTFTIVGTGNGGVIGERVITVQAGSAKGTIQ